MKLFIVTGGSKGLGKALCEKFINEQYHVIEFSRTAPHDFSIFIDLSKPLESKAVIKTALKKFSKLDFEEIIFVSNAATLGPIGETSNKLNEELIENININYTSTIIIISELISNFQSVPCKKIIANISSGAALKGYFGWSLYCAAKAGIENYIRALASEQIMHEFGFTPINIDPGVMDTGMQAKIRNTSKSDFIDVERFIERKNQGKLEDPSKVASAIVKILRFTELSAGNRYSVEDYF